MFYDIILEHPGEIAQGAVAGHTCPLFNFDLTVKY
jgi:hypothetical protein